MKIIRDYIGWWMVLLAMTVVVSVLTSVQVTPVGLLGSVIGHFLFAIGAAFIPWLVYHWIGKPLTPLQMMWTITVGWLILAVANLSV